MTQRWHPACLAPSALVGALLAALSLSALADPGSPYPITEQQRSTAKKVAEAGVPLSELAPNAPDSHTVVKGDTLWGISKIFLKSPWRWPELWGMNLDAIRNPHLIYPGQVLYLDKSNGRARLTTTKPGEGMGGAVKLSPSVRASDLDDGAIPSIPLHLIAPFLNEAAVFNGDEMARAPRIVAAQEGRVLLSKGDTAYVRGDTGGQLDFRVFRQGKTLVDPTTKEVLGYEAPYLGTAEYVRAGEEQPAGKGEIVPATVRLTSIRQEVNIGDRLAPVPPRDFSNYVPHAPNSPVSGQIVSVYGDAITAGQNQIVSLNRGSRDGMERGHVLALWRDGSHVVDSTDPSRPQMKLPDERHGMLFVFRVFDRVSYALILSVQEPVKAGDRFTSP